ncbi:MAG TPA: hypothetical protein VEN78_34355 [Bradyrhizobium sp.]|nr:hypothetical protein [Bradyrhizobium sp.]
MKRTLPMSAETSGVTVLVIASMASGTGGAKTSPKARAVARAVVGGPDVTV